MTSLLLWAIFHYDLLSFLLYILTPFPFWLMVEWRCSDHILAMFRLVLSRSVLIYVSHAGIRNRLRYATSNTLSSNLGFLPSFCTSSFSFSIHNVIVLTANAFTLISDLRTIIYLLIFFRSRIKLPTLSEAVYF